MSHENSSNHRGRRAEKPDEITRRGWFDIVWRVLRAAKRDRLTMLAAGVAFYALLALFPTIAAVISLWGLLFDPVEAGRQLYEISRFMPPDAANLIDQQTQAVVESTESGNVMAVFAGLLVAMYIASKGVGVLVIGLNVVYGEKEQRNIFLRGVVLILLTFGLIGMTLISLGFIAIVPVLVDALTVEPPFDKVFKWLRWPALLIIMSFLIALLYRFAPYRRAAQWRWLSYGTLLATTLWLLGSGGLSLYVRYFSSFSELYGSLGAVVVLMMWFWLSAFVVLLGAEVNSEMERQTSRDTTVGEERPLGEREAFAADTLGVENPWNGDKEKTRQ
ncbi:YihY/virulence factor BrkB family protein [Vreelandella populi]|uniref:YihY/virulence factor BrkB family protein n=1 Tax=Vreelandella populi TaxID=2498858 RepID=A0A433LFU5_9GAMM|nr:YihY/virulence factor BrkB family protein [Halomonas populi]RUR37891.1 YihY/virulence factor BrkB family protein [Halomonas populi]RUR48869.1 YihY/virulence factor BrkB family protein [Halomonas populi]